MHTVAAFILASRALAEQLAVIPFQLVDHVNVWVSRSGHRRLILYTVYA